MKYPVITIATVLIFISIFASKVSASDYKNVMQQNIDKMYKTKAIEDLVSISGTFYRVSEKENTEWLPLYYASYSLVRVAFFTKDSDEIHKQLDVAQEYIDKLLKEHSEEAEIHVLQALLYSMRITSPTKGMKYSILSNEALDEAAKLDNENPRLHYCRANNTFYTPSFFGGGKAKAKPIFERAALLFEKDNSDVPFWPTWGKLNNKEMLAKCNED